MNRTGWAKGIAMVLVASLAGCSPSTKEARNAEPTPAESFVFQCDGTSSFSVSYEQDVAVLRLSDRVVRLPQVLSGSGARYSDGTTTFWTKGDTAQLEVEGRPFDCRIAERAP